MADRALALAGQAGDCKAAEEGYLPEAVHFLIPTLLSFRIGSKPSEEKACSPGLCGML